MTPVGRWREGAAWLVAGALLLSVPASLPKLEWNVHVWKRLRAANRTSPDADSDRRLSQLKAVLPGDDVVGFHFAGPGDNGRTFLRLRYALSPLRLRQSIEPEVVVESGPVAEADSLAHDEHFTLIHQVDDLRVFRRVVR